MIEECAIAVSRLPHLVHQPREVLHVIGVDLRELLKLLGLFW